MKLEFTHAGNMHEFVMAMLQGKRFTLVNEYKKTLDVTPRIGLEEEGFSIRSGSCNSQMIMTIPVTIRDFNAPALMTFEYKIDPEQVAPAVAAVEPVDARPAQGDLPEQEARPAIEARPKVLMPTFQRGVTDYNGTSLKFE